MCRNFHVDQECENKMCNVSMCIQRHPKQCKYYREFNRCKFAHIEYIPREIELVKIREDNLKTVEKLAEIKQMLNEKNDLETKIKDCDEKLQAFEIKICELEANLVKRDETIGKLVSKNQNDEKMVPKKKAILQRLEDVEKKNDEKVL